MYENYANKLENKNIIDNFKNSIVNSSNIVNAKTSIENSQSYYPEKLIINIKNQSKELTIPIYKTEISSPGTIRYKSAYEEPLYINLIYLINKQEFRIDITVRFNRVNSVKELLSVSNFYNDIFNGTTLINGEKFNFDKNNKSQIPISDNTLNYFKDIEKINKWLNLDSFNFQDLFEKETIDLTRTFINSMELKPSFYPYKLKDITTTIDSETEIKEINEKLKTEEILSKCFFKTDLTFDYLGEIFRLPTLIYLNNFAITRISPLRNGQASTYLNYPKNSNAYASYMVFPTRRDLDDFVDSHSKEEILKIMQLNDEID